MTRQIEDQVVDAISRFHRDQQGHAPSRVDAFVVGELIVVRCQDVFTPTERDLAQTSEGKKLIQSARRDQRALTRRDVEREVGRVVDRSILRSFYDIDTRNGEQVEVYVLDRPL